MSKPAEKTKLTRAEKSEKNKARYKETTAQAVSEHDKFVAEGSKLINPPGRPSKYSKKLVDQIMEHVAVGESLRTIASYENMPTVRTLMNWLQYKPEFFQRYTRAKEYAVEAFADDIIDIADNGSNDYMEKYFGNHKSWVVNGENVQRSKLRIDTRIFLAQKLLPKKYGERIDVTSGGDKLPAPLIYIPQELKYNDLVPSESTPKKEAIEGEIIKSSEDEGKKA